MKNIIIALVFSVFGISSAFSQMVSYDMDINGLVHDEKYTDAQIRQVLGVPTKHEVTNDSDPQHSYIYNILGSSYADRFEFNELDGFYDFLILSPRFKLYGGRVKVGDNISVFNNLGGGLLKKIDNTEYNFYHSGGEYLQDEYLRVRTNSNGVITILNWITVW